jgi:hypothetical protein
LLVGRLCNCYLVLALAHRLRELSKWMEFRIVQILDPNICLLHRNYWISEDSWLMVSGRQGSPRGGVVSVSSELLASPHTDQRRVCCIPEKPHLSKTIYEFSGSSPRIPDFPHQNTPRIKNTRIRISPRTLIINYSTTTYPNKIILNYRVESIEILSLCNSIFLSKALW